MARVVFHKGVFHILCIFRRNHVDNRPKQTLYNIQEWKVECAVMKAEELWGSACKILQEEMTRISYSTWIETALKPCALVGDTVLLECVSPVVQQMGTSRYMGQIQKAVSTAAGRALTVEVYGHEELKDRLKALEARSSGDSLALLNPKYTFDTFVVGSSNPVCARGVPGGSGGARQGVQPAVHLWRRGPGQDAPDARHRTLCA